MNRITMVLVAIVVALVLGGGYTLLIYHAGGKAQQGKQVAAVVKQIKKEKVKDAKIDKKVPASGNDAAIAEFLRSSARDNGSR